MIKWEELKSVGITGIGKMFIYLFNTIFTQMKRQITHTSVKSRDFARSYYV